MNKRQAENPVKYLNSRLGIVNEALKKAYISGKRILVLLTDELDLVHELIERESIIRIETRKTESFTNSETQKTTTTYTGYDTIRCVDNDPSFIGNDAENLKCNRPTIYLSTNGMIPSDSLVNYARHFYSLCTFDKQNPSSVVDNLRKSIILILNPDKSESPNKTIPAVCKSLTEYIKVPYLSEDEFKGIISDWLYQNEGIEVTTTSQGYSCIADKDYIDRMYQAMRALSPAQIISTLKGCSFDFGKVYRPSIDSQLNRIIKSIRAITDSVISKSSALSLIDTSNAAEPNGLQNISQWLTDNKRRINSPKDFFRFQMEVPKGILISGIPGSGKSMLAKHIAAELKLSLVRLDLGDALGSYVGDSEKNFKTALEVAESLSPCVVWIDEMEKMFEAGHEVTRRLTGKFLTWLQEKSDRGASCFVFATANDISRMPPEMFRSGRFDMKFYTFMPCANDCADIFASIIDRHNKKYNEEAPNPLLPLFNTKNINKNFFLKLLSSSDVIKSPVTSTKPDDTKPDNSIPRDNKFFIGADVEQLIIAAKTLYLVKYMDTPNSNAPDAVFESEKFKECIKEALQKLKTYGETNLEKIAMAYSEIARNNFTPASEYEIMPIRGYNEATFRLAARKDHKTQTPIYALPGECKHINQLNHEYDKQLFYIINQVINSISLQIIDQIDSRK